MSCTISQSRADPVNLRASTRSMLNLPGRLVWKDGRAATRFASVVIRDVSESGAFVECVSGTRIPMYRLVHLQTERPTDQEELPRPLRRGRVLAAVFRIDAAGPSAAPHGYGLRLLEEPVRQAFRAASHARDQRGILAEANRSIA